MPKPTSYTDEEILLGLIMVMPRKMTKGQIGRLLGIKSAGQKHWKDRFEKLGEKNLLSIEKLHAGDLFSGEPILTYYLDEKNLEEIWGQYFVHYDKRHDLVNDPFLTPFSAGIWNVTSSPEFIKIVGSKFNFHFLCAKNNVSLVNPAEHIKALNKEKIWKVLDAILSIGWKTEAYRRKPVLMDTLNVQQKKTFSSINSIYEAQIKEHPEDY
ncbi:MAG: hypothetical protein WC652_05455, partial [archaeon]